MELVRWSMIRLWLLNNNLNLLPAVDLLQPWALVIELQHLGTFFQADKGPCFNGISSYQFGHFDLWFTGCSEVLNFRGVHWCQEPAIAASVTGVKLYLKGFIDLRPDDRVIPASLNGGNGHQDR